jgi:hypothetical protein
MDSLHQLTGNYPGNFAHGPGWWAVYLALMILAVAAMLGGMLLGIARAYAPRPSRTEPADLAEPLPGRHAAEALPGKPAA